MKKGRRRMKIRNFCLALVLLLVALPAMPQHDSQTLTQSEHWAATLSEHYLLYPDITYGTANNYALKLDVWQRKDAAGPMPTAIYIHGGGWIFGDRTGATPYFMPYLEMGWNVINVEYRMASVSLAPAAVPAGTMRTW